MAVLLAAISAATFGVGDFLGGLSARRMPAAMVAALAQLSGLVLMVLVCLFLIRGDPLGSDVVRGAGAGLCGGSALIVFYWAMSRGQMSVVAPVSAVLTGLVPVLAGLLAGERPDALSMLGILVAAPAIVLIAREPSPTEAVASAVTVERMDHLPAPPARLARLGGLPVVAAALSGIGFGMFFVLLARTSETSGLWPLVFARSAAALVGLAYAVVVSAVTVTKVGVQLAVATGVLDVVGNSAYLLASRQGLLSVVGVVGAMYPASTVLLARVVLRERLAGHQLIGLGVAVLAVVLIALGA